MARPDQATPDQTHQTRAGVSLPDLNEKFDQPKALSEVKFHVPDALFERKKTPGLSASLSVLNVLAFLSLFRETETRELLYRSKWTRDQEGALSMQQIKFFSPLFNHPELRFNLESQLWKIRAKGIFCFFVFFLF